MHQGYTLFHRKPPPKFEIEALFRHVLLYKDTNKNKKTHIIVKLIVLKYTQKLGFTDTYFNTTFTNFYSSTIYPKITTKCFIFILYGAFVSCQSPKFYQLLDKMNLKNQHSCYFKKIISYKNFATEKSNFYRTTGEVVDYSYKINISVSISKEDCRVLSTSLVSLNVPQTNKPRSVQHKSLKPSNIPALNNNIIKHQIITSVKVSVLWISNKSIKILKCSSILTRSKKFKKEKLMKNLVFYQHKKFYDFSTSKLLANFRKPCIKFSSFFGHPTFFYRHFKKNSHKNRKFQWSINNSKKVKNLLYIYIILTSTFGENFKYLHKIKLSNLSKTGFAVFPDAFENYWKIFTFDPPPPKYQLNSLSYQKRSLKIKALLLLQNIETKCIPFSMLVITFNMKLLISIVFTNCIFDKNKSNAIVVHTLCWSATRPMVALNIKSIVIFSVLSKGITIKNDRVSQEAKRMSRLTITPSDHYIHRHRIKHAKIQSNVRGKLYGTCEVTLMAKLIGTYKISSMKSLEHQPTPE
ncbi:hypothetical protein AGLY_006302 [Aphis glycines]|uniref:Uncharacterized protein n=1 Tax=Aphis glycines TaxID=307491 RepID=A0A6G0TRJ8_APHGL|nr:hypothetical protein AGLY_006302 [Aphis glycines]